MRKLRKQEIRKLDLQIQKLEPRIRNLRFGNWNHGFGNWKSRIRNWSGMRNPDAGPAAVRKLRNKISSSEMLCRKPCDSKAQPSTNALQIGGSKFRDATNFMSCQCRSCILLPKNSSKLRRTSRRSGPGELRILYFSMAKRSF